MREGFTGGAGLSRFQGPTSFTCLENKVMSIFHFRYTNIYYLKSLYFEVGIPRFDYKKANLTTTKYR